MFYLQIEHLQSWSESISSIYGNAGHRFTRHLYELEMKPQEAIAQAVDYYQEKTQGMVIPPKEFRTAEHLQLVCLNYVTNYFPKLFHTFPIKVEKDGKKIVGTELEFSIPYAVNDNYEIVLCGTLDKAYKGPDGRIVIRDYKFTSQWDSKAYLHKAAHMASLRFYSMMLKKFLDLPYYPPAELEGIFLSRLKKQNPKLEDVCRVEASERVEFYDDDMDIFKEHLDRTMARWVGHLDQGEDKESWPMDWFQCSGKWGDCTYMDLCRVGKDEGLYAILKEGFVSDHYNPLKFQN